MSGDPRTRQLQQVEAVLAEKEQELEKWKSRIKDSLDESRKILNSQKEVLAMFRETVTSLEDTIEILNSQKDVLAKFRESESYHHTGSTSQPAANISPVDVVEDEDEIMEYEVSPLDSAPQTGSGILTYGMDTFHWATLLVAAVILVITGNVLYKWRDGFKLQPTGSEGVNEVVSVCYFTSVSVFTVGYGDIVPTKPSTTLLSDMIALVTAIVPLVLSYWMIQVTKRLEEKYLSHLPPHIRFWSKVCICLFTICAVIMTGMAGIFVFERPFDTPPSPSPSTSVSLSPSATATPTPTILGWVKMIHLSIMTITSVGYGDFSFVTTNGRIFSAIFIPFAATIYGTSMHFLVKSGMNLFHGRHAEVVQTIRRNQRQGSSRV